MFLILALVFSTAVFNVSAATTQTISDLVVFVKYKSDTADEFNESTNWNKIKSFYNDTTNLYSNYEDLKIILSLFRAE